MIEVSLDPRQAPARAELLLGADFGREARGRPIHGRLASEDGGAGKPGPWLKPGAVRTRRLAVSEGADRPSASAYGNALGGTRDDAPAVPIGAPLVARTNVPDARGWRRVYRVTLDGAVIYDEWIEHDPANAERALAELRVAAATSPAAALRGAVERGGPATRARKRSCGGSPAGRPSGRALRRSPGRGWPGGRGVEPSRGNAAAHDAPHREPRRPAVDANRRPWSATGPALQPVGPPDDDDDHGRRAACCRADAVRRHAPVGPAVATILTTAHRLESCRLTVRDDLPHGTVTPLPRYPRPGSRSRTHAIHPHYRRLPAAPRETHNRDGP